MLMCSALLLGMIACKSHKATSINTATATEQSVNSKAEQSATTTTDANLQQSQTCDVTTTTETIKFGAVPDAQGNPVPIPTETTRKTTTRHGTSSRQSTLKQQAQANTQAQAVASQSTDSHSKASQKTSVKTPAFDWTFGIIAAAMAALWLWIKYRPPSIIKKIFSKLK